MIITEIQLPAQTGCEHMHVFIEDNGVTTMYAYHMTDFGAIKTIQNDVVYNFMFDKIKELNLRKRADIKTRLTGLTF